MKNIISIVVLMITLFSTSVIQAVETKYIPNTSQAVFSIKLNELSSKAEISLQNTLNKLFMQKFADNFATYRDDAYVVEAMTNRLEQILDFSKPSKIVSFNSYQEIAVMIDILDVTELNRIMIKIASQEDKLISFSDNNAYRYFYLDDTTLISWNDEVFTVETKLDDVYWYNEELNKENDIINIANSIFDTTSPLTNEKFMELENQTNDFYAWVDLSLLSDETDEFTKFLFGRSYEGISKESYKDAILTAKVNFNIGNADIVIDTYSPNYPYDSSLLKKELADNIYTFVNGENNYGFLSLAFNSTELSKHLKTMFGEQFPFSEDFEELEEYGIDVYKLIELLGGDIFVSAWDSNENEDPDLLISASITDENTIKIILDSLADDVNNDVYTLAGNTCYVKDSILYISSNPTIIEKIMNNEMPNVKLNEDKINLAKNNTFVFYLELNSNLALYGIGDEYTENFESVYLTSNILEANHTQVLIKVNTRDKEKNALSIIKTFIGGLE
ncbi:DUF4836 family protein [Brachyspira pilosicoli]|uniref:DUF4836 family protein n=1 Tax=Brachyspira pilosicoli TaxID=52584 RepID=UPI001CA4BB1D|nr:DUF4836 family protein [Brachyspira pilosicoli]MBW5397215.1 DUF4836 domain-containing protein [Brachyspira pilosicoli]